MSAAFMVVDALDRVFHDTIVSTDGRPGNVSLAGPRGGRASFQLACRGLTGDPKFTVAAFRRNKRPHRLRHQVHRLLFVPVEVNTSWDPIALPQDQRTTEEREQLYVDERLDPRMAPHVLRAAPFELAEVLAPVGARRVQRDRPTVYFLAFDIDRDARPGVYTGKVTVNAGGEAIEIPIEIAVSKLTVPARQTLKVTNWFNLDNIAKHHKVKLWSPPYWSMLQKYAKLMRRYGQNVFWIQRGVFLEGTQAGRPVFNWPRFDRYVKLFLNEGFELIEGCHFANRKYGDDITKGEYVISGTGADAVSLAGQEWLCHAARSLWEHLKSRRWDKIYVQHVADEPAPAEAPAYLRIANLLRKMMPGVRLIDAILGTPAVQAALDIHVPNFADLHIPGIDRDPEFDRLWTFENFRQVAAMGNGEFWCYTCCGPRGPALNRFLDFPLIKTRLLHWLNFLEDATGYLHWGLNMYRQDQDPFTDTMGAASATTMKLPPGDTHVVWPGDDGPWPSLRLEAMRDGIIDYEILKVRAAKSDASAARDLARQTVRSLVDYVTDVREFREIHKTLLGLERIE